MIRTSGKKMPKVDDPRVRSQKIKFMSTHPTEPAGQSAVNDVTVTWLACQLFHSLLYKALISLVAINWEFLQTWSHFLVLLQLSGFSG